MHLHAAHGNALSHLVSGVPMPLITRRDESYGYAPDAFAFWRNQAVYFCLFSVLGHWMEIVYCSFMNIFGIVDPESLVWDDPMYPFCVYGITVLVCMAMELTMGLMLNQPDAAGNYPLWDNSQLPGNILGQAWIVNDVGLGAVAMLYTWVVYPLCQKALAKVPIRIMNAAAAIIVVEFVVLCVVKFS